MFEELLSIEYIGVDDVWDIEVEGTHTFFANGVAVHNCQGMNIEHIPIIREVISGSPIAVERFTGTPKSKTNTLSAIFYKSSQAHFAITCDGCRHENIICPDNDVYRNIGKHGPICSKCGKALQPRTGYFVHKYPDRRWEHSGYSAGQLIHPLHTDYEHKWRAFLKKMETMGQAQFENECLAFPSEGGSRLVTTDQLKRCAQLEKQMTLSEIRHNKADFSMLVTAVDWGGRGLKKNKAAVRDESDLEWSSYTAIAVIGVRRKTGLPEVLWLERLAYDTDPTDEASRTLDVFLETNSDLYAHDFTGAGNIRETLVIQQGTSRGLRVENIMPIRYGATGPGKSIISLMMSDADARHYYMMDKARACFMTAFLIQKVGVLFGPYAEVEALVVDFTSWIEDSQESPSGAKSTRVVRDPALPDDVAQAVVIGLCALFHGLQSWPDLAAHVSNYVYRTTDNINTYELDADGEQPDWSDPEPESDEW